MSDELTAGGVPLRPVVIYALPGIARWLEDHGPLQVTHVDTAPRMNDGGHAASLRRVPAARPDGGPTDG